MFHELSAAPFASIPHILGRFGARESRCASFDVNDCLADGPLLINTARAKDEHSLDIAQTKLGRAAHKASLIEKNF